MSEPRFPGSLRGIAVPVLLAFFGSLGSLGFFACFAFFGFFGFFGSALGADAGAVRETSDAPVAPEASSAPGTWIAVTAPAFREAIEPLAEHRRGEGYRVLVVETSDVLLPERIREGDGSPLKEHLSRLYREAEGASTVLLVGAVKASGPDDAPRTVIPPLRGTVGRMEGRPTDNGYGNPEESLLPRIAVGRLPARSVDEARAMVAKTLAFERVRAPGPWADRITLLIGHPGGRTPVEKRLGEWFVQNAGARRFERIAPRWTARVVFHAPQSPYSVPDSRLREMSLRYLEEGQVLSIYLGHSSASGLWSEDAPFLSRDDWARLKIASGSGAGSGSSGPGERSGSESSSGSGAGHGAGHGAGYGAGHGAGHGVFITCGCYACQLSGLDGEGFGLAAVRNPGGPAAVIGAHGESYGAIGQLALDGILPLLAAAEPPARLGQWWLALAGGIARAGMDPLTFFLYDQADGSRGRVALAVQRREHLEMWMLLGDPAMRLPLVPMDIALECDGAVGPGGSITVRGSRPGTPPGTRVVVTIERPFGSAMPEPSAPSTLPQEAGEAGEPGEAGDEAVLDRHERANSVIIARREAAMADGRFECAFTLPDPLPWARLTIRARAETQGAATAGVLSVEAAP